MNDKEAMQALLAGKKIRLQGWEDGAHLFMGTTGDITDEAGDAFVVAFERLEHGDDDDVNEWEVLESKPVPGTLRWALSEIRGKRATFVRSRSTDTLVSSDTALFSAADVLATDWEILP